MTLGALEPKFYAALLEKLGLADVDPKAQYDQAAWPALKARFRALFLSRPSAHWRALLEGSDACFAPVLSLAEAAAHPHNAARGVYPTRRRAVNWTPPRRRASFRSAEPGPSERNTRRTKPDDVEPRNARNAGVSQSRSAEARRSDRSSSGRLVGAISSPVPARPRQRLPDRGRRRARAHRRGDRQPAVARRLGGASRRAASRAQADAGHRHPLPPRPRRPRRMALRALRPASWR